MIEIRALSSVEVSAHLPDLAQILRECVADGASVHFLKDINQDSAEIFWGDVLKKTISNEVVVLAALSDGVLAGTVSLLLNTPPNQKHRAEVSKFLVSPRFRRLGIGKSLMLALERLAVEYGRDLLVLDTATGSAAEKLYLTLGWKKVGEIPRYALTPEGIPAAATYFYKELVISSQIDGPTTAAQQ